MFWFMSPRYTFSYFILFNLRGKRVPPNLHPLVGFNKKKVKKLTLLSILKFKI